MKKYQQLTDKKRYRLEFLLQEGKTTLSLTKYGAMQAKMHNLS